MSIERLIGKRFSGLLLTAGILGAGYFFGPVEKFSQLATTLGLMYLGYIGGQSYTDGKKP